jgi:hypothetical protein
MQNRDCVCQDRAAGRKQRERDGWVCATYRSRAAFNPRLVAAARESLGHDFGSGDLDPNQRSS